MKTLSFAQTLHPETAEEWIDCFPESSQGSTAASSVGDGSSVASPWTRVIQEAWAEPPVAYAKRVDIVDNFGNDEEDRCASKKVEQTTENSKNGDEHHDDNKPTTEQAPTPSTKKGSGCFGLEGLVGYTLTFSAIVSTFAIELTAAIVYCLAAGFHYVAHLGSMGDLFKTIFLLIVHVLMIADAVLLTTSVLLTEVLAVVAFITTSIFGVSGCHVVGPAWHTHVRRVCHLSRWAFREFHSGWQPPRIFPVDIGKSDSTNSCSPTPTAALSGECVVVENAELVTEQKQSC